MCFVRFFPLILLLAGSVVCATPFQAKVQDTGVLDNQLRQRLPTSVTPYPYDNNNTSTLTVPSAVSLNHTRNTQNDTHIHLSEVRFEGDVAEAGIPVTRLQSVVANLLNTSLSFKDLQTMVNQLTALYRAEGLLAARVILPTQTIKRGVLIVRVLAGHYNTGQVKNASTLRTSVVQRILSTTTPEGQMIRQAQLEREALLLSELPGVNAQLSLIPGAVPGTGAPVVHLKPGVRLAGYIGLDNQGDKATGRSRMVANVQVNTPLGLGDRLSIDLMDAWEKNDLFNGNLDYSLPVGGYGTRVGFSYSHLNYHYNLLQNSFNGYSNNWNGYANHPWIRTAAFRMDVRLEGGKQYLTDTYPLSLFSFHDNRKGRKHVSSGSLSVRGSLAALSDSTSTFMLKGTFGEVDYRDKLSRLMSFSQEAGTAGRFARMNWLAVHEQVIRDPISAYARLSSQFALHNLDSSQKLLLGGPTAVRAYNTGDGSVDKGALFTAEVRSHWDLSLPLPSWTGAEPSLTVATFFDQGWGQQYGKNCNASGKLLTSHNRVNLSGVGVYTTLSSVGNYALTMTWAHRIGNSDPVSGSDDNNHFWVSVMKMF